MTSPERIRRRQRLEGALIVLIGIFVIFQSVDSRRADSQQSACLVEVIHDLTDSLEARTQNTPRDTLLKKRATAASQYLDQASGAIWTVYVKPAKYLSQHPGGEIPPKRAARLGIELVDAIIRYGVVSKRVDERRTRLIKKNVELDEIRNTTPIPKFPEGSCD